MRKIISEKCRVWTKYFYSCPTPSSSEEEPYKTDMIVAVVSKPKLLVHAV